MSPPLEFRKTKTWGPRLKQWRSGGKPLAAGSYGGGTLRRSGWIF